MNRKWTIKIALGDVEGMLKRERLAKSLKNIMLFPTKLTYSFQCIMQCCSGESLDHKVHKLRYLVLLQYYIVVQQPFTSCILTQKVVYYLEGLKQGKLKKNKVVFVPFRWFINTLCFINR